MRYLLSKELLFQWLLAKQGMTLSKVQSMLYYEYAWFLVFLNHDRNSIHKALFYGVFQAQVNGVIEPKIQNLSDQRYFKQYGNAHHIMNLIKVRVHNRSVVKNIQAIYNIYHKYNGQQLSKIIRRERPWKVTRTGLIDIQPSHRIISKKSMYDYYSQLYQRIQK